MTWLGALLDAVTQRLGMKRIVYSALALVGGAVLALGIFTFGFAKGYSYLGHDAAACNNCHAMNPYYTAWTKGPHHAVATCNDCHAPHDNVVHKYYVKAENGFWHSLRFTANNYPENIMIRDKNLKVTQGACLSCHKEFVSRIQMGRPHDQRVSCVQCHAEVGHMR